MPMIRVSHLAQSLHSAMADELTILGSTLAEIDAAEKVTDEHIADCRAATDRLRTIMRHLEAYARRHNAVSRVLDYRMLLNQ